jgi:hypothetical protein
MFVQTCGSDRDLAAPGNATRNEHMIVCSCVHMIMCACDHMTTIRA